MRSTRTDRTLRPSALPGAKKSRRWPALWTFGLVAAAAATIGWFTAGVAEAATDTEEPEQIGPAVTNLPILPLTGAIAAIVLVTAAWLITEAWMAANEFEHGCPRPNRRQSGTRFRIGDTIWLRRMPHHTWAACDRRQGRAAARRPSSARVHCRRAAKHCGQPDQLDCRAPGLFTRFGDAGDRDIQGRSKRRCGLALCALTAGAPRHRPLTASGEVRAGNERR